VYKFQFVGLILLRFIDVMCFKSKSPCIEKVQELFLAILTKAGLPDLISTLNYNRETHPSLL